MGIAFIYLLQALGGLMTKITLRIVFKDANKGSIEKRYGPNSIWVAL